MIYLWALVPPILVILLFYLLDPKRKPLKAIGIVAGWSLMAFVPSIIFVCLEKLALYAEIWHPTNNALLQQFEDAFIGAAIPEEVGKWLALWLFVKKYREYFRAPYDGILFGACIAAIFAGLENIYYLGIGSPIYIRLFFSLPVHTMSALIMGYFFALLYFGESTWRNKICMFLLPILFHGSYDFLLFLMRSETFGSGGNILIFLLVITLFIVEIAYCVKLTKSLRRRSLS